MNNIIFGLYNGYNSLKTSSGGIYYFMKSLRKYNTECKIVIVCERYNIFKDLVHFSKEMNFKIYTNFKTRYGLQQSRYEVYYEYLNNTNDVFDKILLSDVNDVIFQEDPFAIDFTGDIYCALEQSILTDKNNSSSECNMNWIDKYNNCQKNYANFNDQFVVCSGTILGTFAGIKTFLHFYDNVQKTNPIDIHGIDQGIYNIYVYNYLSSKQLVHYKESKILTLDKIQFKMLNFDSDDNIINDKGEKYSIVHQINRCNLPFMLSLV
jgi:hypothetical protein